MAMSDYIKREDAIAVINNYVGDDSPYAQWLVRKIGQIDDVPLVRCKDCKNYAFADNRVPQERVWWCYYWGYEIGSDDFCSMGERKDNEID